MMKNIVAVFILLLGAGSVFADTPVGPMNYQGRLLNDGGIPVTGSYNFVVRVYDAVSGGALKYQENHNAVAVDDGVYAFLVGTQTKSGGDSTWSVELWNCCNTLFLEIVVNGETLAPRHRLAAAPFAFQANLALTTNDALALGGKSAAEYDSTLEAICVSSKGKWLELVEKCLGIGASFPQQIEPAPPFVSWNTLTASDDFSNLDLSRADISGISFSGANFSGTTFRSTTYYVGSFNDANLTDTVWDGAIAVAGMYPEYVGANTLMNGAVFKNMDMSQWGLSLVSQPNMVGLSAANLTGCPSDLPAAWECRYDGVVMYDSFLLGPGVNLSANSAAAVSKFGSSYLNLGSDVLSNIDLNGASFEGNVITQNFNEAILVNANFNYTVMRSNVFANADLTGATFVGSRFDKPVFLSSVAFNNNNFTNAELSYVRFEKDVQGANFTKATLATVDFLQGISNSNFTSAVLDEVTILGNTGDNIFDGTRFYHGFQHGGVGSATNTYQGGGTFNDLTFIGGNLQGDFKGAVFTGITRFDNVTFTHINLCAANIAMQDPEAPYYDLDLVNWSAGLIRCPDSFLVAPNDTFHCNNYVGHMTPIPVAECTAGVP